MVEFDASPTSVIEAIRNDEKLRRSVIAWGFLLPAFVILFVYRAIPIFWNVYLSFFTRDIVGELTFVGLGNYVEMFNDSVFWMSTFNTILFIGTIPIGIVIALGLALLFDQKFPANNVLRALIFLPYITMMVAIGVIWSYMLHPNGIVNHVLVSTGLLDSGISWLGSSLWARVSVYIVHVWKSVGFYMIIILAGLQTIPNELYEVAEIDGASPYQRFRYVTLPMLRPTIGVCVLVGLTLSFELFDLIIVLTNGGPGKATEILITYLYKNAFSYGKMGYGAAITVALFVITLTLGLVARYYQRGYE